MQSADRSGWDGVISWHTFSDAIRFVVGPVTIAFICVGAIAIERRGLIYDPETSSSLVTPVRVESLR